jgi:hypothetical protein
MLKVQKVTSGFYGTSPQSETSESSFKHSNLHQSAHQTGSTLSVNSNSFVLKALNLA